jgi:hypothetical protein
MSLTVKTVYLEDEEERSEGERLALDGEATR